MFTLPRSLAVACAAVVGVVAWAAPFGQETPGSAPNASLEITTQPPTASPSSTQPAAPAASALPTTEPTSKPVPAPHATPTSQPSSTPTRAAVTPGHRASGTPKARRAQVAHDRAAATRTWAPYAVRAKACRTGRLVLTFDDGPHPQRTRELYRWLTRHDVPATFFMVGSRVQGARDITRALDANPRLFTLANHTWRHPDLRALPDAEVHRTLADTRRAINSVGHASALMRPPYGALNPRVSAAIAQEKLVPVLWNVDSLDWKGGNRHEIAARILAQLQPKRANVVLQHDGITNSYESVRAVPIVVAQAQRRGYCVVPLKADGTAGSMLSPAR